MKQVNRMRAISLGLMGLVMGLVSFLLGILYQISLQEGLCLCLIDISFFGVLCYELEYERKLSLISFHPETTFGLVGCVFCISMLGMIGFSFLPAFCRPFALCGLMLSAVSSPFFAICGILYECLVFSFVCTGDFYEMLSLLLLFVTSLVIAKGLVKESTRIFAAVSLFALQVLYSAVFSYLANGCITPGLLAGQIVIGLICAALGVSLYPRLYDMSKSEHAMRLMDLLDENYPYLEQVKKAFPEEYQRAVLMAGVNERCAKAVGLTEDLCTAAGFYYRISLWQKEESVLAGVRKAQSLCFPTELTTILFEYKGQEQKPTTTNSALAFITDHIYDKLSEVSEEQNPHKFSLDMIIMQEMNELSRIGVLDQSGLSMNLFIKIRDYLIKEQVFHEFSI